MGKRIIALIRKDLRFNWQIAAGVLAIAVVFMPVSWIEAQFDGGWDLRYPWQWCWFVAAAGFLVVNPSLRIEQGASTKSFLAALPFTMKELLLSKIIENVVYTILCAGILTFGFLVVAFPMDLKYLWLGVPISIFCNTIYTVINYLADFEKAQIFLLSALMVPMIAGGWMKVDFAAMAFFTDPAVSAGASAVMLLLSIVMIVLMCKRKRSIL